MQKCNSPKTIDINAVTSNNDGTKSVARTVENETVEYRNTSFDGIRIYRAANRIFVRGMKQ